MDTKVTEYEKKQSEVANKYRKVLSKLEGSYKKSEDMINSINKKRKELSAARRRLWNTIVFMAILIGVAAVLKNYL